jgi:hypothetical protein
MMGELTQIERQLVFRIATRCVEVLQVEGRERVIATGAFIVILGTVHRDVCPLDLELMATAPDFDLLHDLIGMREHLDMKAKILRDGFLPRCAKV